MEKGERNIFIVAVFGMAFWWPMLRNSVVGFLLSPDRVGEAWGHCGVCLFLVLAAIAAIGMALSPGRERLFSVPLPLAAAVGLLVACVLASVLGLLLVESPVPARGALVIANVVVLAAVYVALPIAWGALLLEMTASSPKRLLLVMSASYAVSFLVGYLSYAPVPWNLIRPVGAPLISGAAWFCCRMMAAKRAGCCIASSPAVPPSREGASSIRSLYVLVLVIFLVSSVATGFINSGTASYAPSMNTLVRDTLNVIVTLAIIALIAASKSLERVKFTLVVVLIVLLFSGIFLATLFQQSWFTVGIGLMQTSKSCVSLLLLMLVLLENSRSDASMTERSLLLKFVVPTLASTFISYLIVPLIAEGLGLAYSDFWGVLSLLLGFALGVFLFVFLSSLVIRYLPGATSSSETSLGSEAPAGPDATASAMREVYGLTEKEAEVLALLLEGNTYKKIAALMYVSDSTVQSHAKSIYRKVDVHTKQELVDRAMELRGRRTL